MLSQPVAPRLKSPPYYQNNRQSRLRWFFQKGRLSPINLHNRPGKISRQSIAGPPFAFRLPNLLALSNPNKFNPCCPGKKGRRFEN